MRVRRFAGLVAGIVLGFTLGASVTAAIQGWASLPDRNVRTRPGQIPETEPQPPDAFLVWTSGGMPAGFRQDVRHLDGIRRSVVVASDNAWLDRSWSAQGEVIDDPRSGFAIPLEVAAVDPRDFAPFLPPADRSVSLALADAQGILGESSSRLRGLGPGAVMRFGDVRIEVAAILPDELVGASELMVSREVGRSIGVTTDRYALVLPETARTGRGVERLLDPLLPSDAPSKVRAPGDTPYFRQGDAVLPPVRIKLLFGEFAARPTPGRPGYLTLDPAWARRNIDTRRVPLLGSVTCNVALFPQIRGVVHELVERGLQDTIQSFSGCFSARHINRIPSAALSHHSWGIALDLNVQQGNLFGQTPHQDPRLVRVFERWGFVWGGTFIVPDGMHFEYHREPAED
jgi:D-alanyl-D-alanine carboxypeptidase